MATLKGQKGKETLRTLYPVLLPDISLDQEGVVPLLHLKPRDVRTQLLLYNPKPTRKVTRPKDHHSFSSSELSRTPKRAACINTVVPSLDIHLGNHLQSFNKLCTSRPHTLRFWFNCSGVGPGHFLKFTKIIVVSSQVVCNLLFK